MKQNLKILVIDDDAIVRSTIKLMVGRVYPAALISLVASLEDAIKALGQTKFDIIVLDINLGRDSGLSILHECTHSENPTSVLVMSARSEEEVALVAFKAGAKGYICKDQIAEGQNFVDAIKLILEGKNYISSTIADYMVADLGNHKKTELSEQEQRVLLLIGSGRSVKQIAADMEVSEKTIRTYRVRVLAKLKLESDADMVRYAIQAGLIN